MSANSSRHLGLRLEILLGGEQLAAGAGRRARSLRRCRRALRAPGNRRARRTAPDASRPRGSRARAARARRVARARSASRRSVLRRAAARCSSARETALAIARRARCARGSVVAAAAPGRRRRRGAPESAIRPSVPPSCEPAARRSRRGRGAGSPLGARQQLAQPEIAGARLAQAAAAGTACRGRPRSAIQQSQPTIGLTPAPRAAR